MTGRRRKGGAALKMGKGGLGGEGGRVGGGASATGEGTKRGVGGQHGGLLDGRPKKKGRSASLKGKGEQIARNAYNTTRHALTCSSLRYIGSHGLETKRHEEV